MRQINKAIVSNALNERLMRELERRHEMTQKENINICIENVTLPDPKMVACAPHIVTHNCNMDK